MKKIKYLIILFAFVFIIEPFNTVKADEKMYINSDNSLRTEDNSYMSVSDIYGINIFDETTKENQEKYAHKNAEKENDILESVFNDNNKPIDEIEQTSLKYNLFTKEKTVEKKKYESNEEDSNVIVMTVIIFILINIIAGLLTIKFLNKRKRKDDFDYDSYTRI